MRTAAATATVPTARSGPPPRRLLLGFVDVAGSSLASFAVGVVATRYLPAEQLGVYALFFTAFLLGAVVPAQLLCVPAEIRAVGREPAAQYQAVRALLPVVAGAGALTAVVGALAIAAIIGPGRPGYAALAVTMIPTSALSPFQDHLRRLAYQADRARIATWMSVVQVAVTVGTLSLLLGMGAPMALVPFGALGAANVVSSAVGIGSIRRAGLTLSGRREPLGELARTGRWLAGAGVAQAAGGLGSLMVVTGLAGVVQAGYCEAVRVLSQPLYVAATGMMAVLNPVIFRAEAAGETERTRRAHRLFRVMIVVLAVLWVVVSSGRNPFNPLRELFPAAYARTGLLEAVILSQAVFFLPLTAISTLLARRRVRDATLGQLVAFGPQIMLSVTAAAVGAWGFVLGAVGAALTRIWMVGYRAMRSDQRRGAARDRGDDGAQRRPFRNRTTTNKARLMDETHPAGDLSIIGAVRRHPAVFGTWIVLGGLLGVLAGVISHDRYVGTADIVVQDPRADSLFTGGSPGDPRRYTADQAGALTSSAVVNRAVELLSARGVESPSYDEVSDALSVESSEVSNTLTVRYAADDPIIARSGVDAVLTAYEDLVARRLATGDEAANEEIDRRIASLEAEVAALDAELAQLQVAQDTVEASRPGGASVRDARIDALLGTRADRIAQRAALEARSTQLAIDRARLSTNVIARSETRAAPAGSGTVLRLTLLGLVLGCLVGASAAYRRARHRRHFLGADEPAQLFGAPRLAVLPAAVRSPSRGAGREPVLEFLATFIEVENRNRPLRRIGFVSPSASPELGPLCAELQHLLGARTARIPAGEPEAAPPAPAGRARRRADLVRAARSTAGRTGRGGHGLNGRSNHCDAPSVTAPGTEVRPDGGMMTISAANGVSRPPLSPAPAPSTPAASAPAAGPAPTAEPKPAPMAPEQPESLVLVEVPEFLENDAKASAQGVDAIVLVLDRSDELAVTAEVVHRVELLRWDLLGYVFVDQPRRRLAVPGRA